MQTFAEVQAASSAAYRTLGDLEWEVESTTVTHSSADWWDLLLPLAYYVVPNSRACTAIYF